MSIKRILKQLKKEKDKIKYLERELKKIEDEKLKNEIEKIIEKLKNEEKKKSNSDEEKVKIPSLEQIAMSIPRMSRMSVVQTEKLENYQSKTRARVAMPGAVEQEHGGARKQQGYSENYGSNIKSDYVRTKADFNRELETSGLITKSSFTTTAESKHAIQQKAGNREEYMQTGDNLNIQQYNVRENMIKEDLTGLTHDLKQAKRGRRNIEVYHG